MNDVELRGPLRCLDRISPRPASTTALDCTPNGGGAMIVCAQKPAKRIAPEVVPRLIVIFRDGAQVNELVSL
jgi:hypothetical protein